MENIHLWNFPYEVSIDLDSKFLIRLRSELKNKYGSWKSIHLAIWPRINFASFKNMLKLSYPNFRNLKLFMKICNNLKISLQELEKNVIAYRTTRGRCIIKNPIFPIEINPIFDMIIAHIFGDGNSVKTEGRELYFNYRQFDKEHRDLFLKKVESLFGKIIYEENYFDSLNRIYLPTIVSIILANYYSLRSEDFLSDRCIVPARMLSHSKEHLLAFLIAFILDEGFIDSAQIVIALHNKKMISDLGKICDILGYEYTISDDKKIPIKGILYILENGVKKFWKDYLLLKEKYPLVFLGYKEDQIKDFIIRKKKLWRAQSEGLTQNFIVEMLWKKPRTTRELAKMLMISRQGIRYHLKQLEKLGITKKVGEGKLGSNIFALLKYQKLPESKKGRSRQYGVTKLQIIDLLKEHEKLDTKELAQKIRMPRSTVYTLLRHMESKKIIKKVSSKIYRTHPTVIWSLSKKLIKN